MTIQAKYRLDSNMNMFQKSGRKCRIDRTEVTLCLYVCSKGLAEDTREALERFRSTSCFSIPSTNHD